MTTKPDIITKTIGWVILAIFTLALPTSASAENYLLNGGQESKISYEVVQKLEPLPQTRELTLSIVVPQSFDSPTYQQRITSVDFDLSPPPLHREDTKDSRGNRIVRLKWRQPTRPISVCMSATAKNSVELKPIQSAAPFPPKEPPEQVRVYLNSTKQVPANDSRIQAKAHELTASARTQFDAVQKILTWMVDHLRYVITLKRFDALYALEKRKGNCQNYSHLSAALLRAVGIPVRIANGITFKQPYDIQLGERTITMKRGNGRHSWIEVYFPDMGWVPFDPQVSELFVSNRFVRIEVGLDNSETKNDGLIRWSQDRGALHKLRFKELISSHFLSDRVEIKARRTSYGPRKMLLSPKVQADFAKLAPKTPPRPKKIPEKELKQLDFTEPYVIGNLEFPEKVDFLSSRGPAQKVEEGEMEMKKNFLVETAEYVTTKGQQYAQAFVLRKPILLKSVGLALHKFNDQGQLWVELYKDNEHRPSEYLATSEMVTVRNLKDSQGYSWVDFGFRDNSMILSPGTYWIALGFTDGPIVNWFFIYGKPVGPQYGTRYKKMFDQTWSRSLGYEFNYRVKGLAPDNL